MPKKSSWIKKCFCASGPEEEDSPELVELTVAPSFPDEIYQCPSNTGTLEEETKADLQAALLSNSDFRGSIHYTGRFNDVRLYETYSKQLLRSLIAHYNGNRLILAMPSPAKYRMHRDGRIKKRALKPGRSIAHYNDIGKQSITSPRQPELAPNLYENTLNFLAEYYFPSNFYIYDPERPLEILNIGVGARDRTDSAILFRHLGNFIYNSVDMVGYNPGHFLTRTHPHSALAIRAASRPEVLFNSRRVATHHSGVSGFDRRKIDMIDLAIMIHPNPGYGIGMIRDSLPYIKPGEDGVLLVVIRKEDFIGQFESDINTLLSRDNVVCRIFGKLDFSIEDDDREKMYSARGMASGSYSRRDVFIMISRNPGASSQFVARLT